MTFRSRISFMLPKRFKESAEETEGVKDEKKVVDKNAIDKKSKVKEKPPMGMIDTTGIQTISGSLGGADQNPDEILKKEGVKIYDEMEAKDTHVYSVYQTRKLAVSMVPWEIYPGDDSDRQQEMADFVFTAIDDCKGTFSEDLNQLLDAIGKGFSILEIVWKLVKEGRWKGKYMIEELLFHKQRYWYFKDKRWHKSDVSVTLFGASQMDAKPVPWEKIIHYAYDAEDNFYGRAAFKPCYWFYWFKKAGWKSWIVFLNKYGTPTAVGTYPPGASKPDQETLLNIVETIQEETGVIIPEGMALSFLEASHAGTASYRELADACNAEISKAILGATQTVEEGRRGSYALSRAHSEVRRERTVADVVDISDVIQQQLVKRVVDYNFVTDVYPQFIMKPFEGRDTPVAEKKKKKAPIAKLPPKEAPEVTPDELPEEEAVIGAPIDIKPVEEEKPSKETQPLGAPLPEGIPVDTPLEPSTELVKIFDRVKLSVEKNYAKKNSPLPINVGPIKKMLQEEFGEEKAVRLAGKVKTYIEMRITVDNIDEVFTEALGQLLEELQDKGA